MKKARHLRVGGPLRDTAPRSADELALLEAFEARRRGFDEALGASNILHGKRPCPCCGWPTLRERDDFEVCVVCLWQDGCSEADPRRVAPPNYVSLERARIDAAAHLREFLARRPIDLAIDPLVRGIKAFELKLRRGEAKIDREDFAANLEQILAMIERG